MAPKDTVELIILRLTYVPYLHPHYPRITYQRRKHPPTTSVSNVQDWYDRVTKDLRDNMPPNVKVQYYEWRIVTGNANLFISNGYRYDKVMLMLGGDNISWIYYQHFPQHRRFEGVSTFPISYCGCCLNNQYLIIMDKILEQQHHTKMARTQI